MGNFLTPVSRKIVTILRKGTTRGKVDHLEHLTKSLTNNTALVAKKYDELKDIESKVSTSLAKIKEEKFKDEIAELRSLDQLDKQEQEKFIGALAVIKEKGIAELTPIGKQAQRIKAHMLVTLNKALNQKVILVAKTQLASNANLQLETLKIISKETKNINKDLTQLLTELDELNKDAIDTNSEFNRNVTDMVGEKSTINVADSIVKKMASVGEKIESVGV